MKSTRPLAIALLSIVPFTAVSTAQAAPATGPSVQQAASVARPADASSEGAGYADTILHRHRHRLQLVDGLLVRHPELRRLFRPGFDGSGSDRPVLELE